MKTLITTLIVGFIALTSARAQDCLGMTMKAGTQIELAMFRPNDKPNGKILYQVKDVRKEGSSTVMDITAQFQDAKGQSQSPFTIHYTCTGNELIADMSGMMSAMQNAGARDMTMKLTTNQLAYPSRLSVGQKLADGKMEVELLGSGTPMTNMTMNMLNREVASKESLTVPAGTFDAYKIMSDMNYESRVMGIPIRSKMRTVSYRTDNQLFDIKSETYDKNGKLVGYMLLNRIF